MTRVREAASSSSSLLPPPPPPSRRRAPRADALAAAVNRHLFIPGQIEISMTLRRFAAVAAATAAALSLPPSSSRCLCHRRHRRPKAASAAPAISRDQLWLWLSISYIRRRHVDIVVDRTRYRVLGTRYRHVDIVEYYDVDGYSTISPWSTYQMDARFPASRSA